MRLFWMARARLPDGIEDNDHDSLYLRARAACRKRLLVRVRSSELAQCRARKKAGKSPPFITTARGRYAQLLVTGAFVDTLPVIALGLTARRGAWCVFRTMGIAGRGTLIRPARRLYLRAGFTRFTRGFNAIGARGLRRSGRRKCAERSCQCEGDDACLDESHSAFLLLFHVAC